MNRGRERRRQPDAAVAVPRAINLDGRKKERKRSRGHHMVDAHRAGVALALRPLPRRDEAVLARLHPRDRLAGCVVRRRQRDRAQPAGLQALGNPREHAVVRLECAVEQHAERSRVDQAFRRRQRRRAGRHQASAPAERTRRQIAQVDTEYFVHVDAGPEACEPFDFLAERLLPRCQVRRVDPAGRHARQDARDDVRKAARKDPEKADLIRGARAAAAEHESQVGSVSVCVHSLAAGTYSTDAQGGRTNSRMRTLSAASGSIQAVYCTMAFDTVALDSS